MSEKEIERRMCEMVRKRGGLSYKFLSPGHPGVPDRIVILPDATVWFVELKTTIGILSNIQKWQVSQLEKQGANVRVIRGWEAAKEFVNEVLPYGI